MCVLSMAISAVAQQVGGQHCGQISAREIWPAGISTSFTFAKHIQTSSGISITSSGSWTTMPALKTSPFHSHTHTHAGKECHLYCGDPPNVPCSALPLVFYATLEEPINLHNSAHRCHDSEAGRGRRSHHRLGHMTLIPIHLHPSINYTYDKTQARGHP